MRDAREIYTDSCYREAFVVPVAPLLPGLALSIVSGGINAPSSKVHTDAGLRNLYTFNWLFGFLVSILLYTALSCIFPDKQTLLAETVWTRGHEVVEGQTSDEEQGRTRVGVDNEKADSALVHDAEPL